MAVEDRSGQTEIRGVYLGGRQDSYRQLRFEIRDGFDGRAGIHAGDRNFKRPAVSEIKDGVGRKGPGEAEQRCGNRLPVGPPGGKLRNPAVRGGSLGGRSCRARTKRRRKEQDGSIRKTAPGGHGKLRERFERFDETIHRPILERSVSGLKARVGEARLDAGKLGIR